MSSVSRSAFQAALDAAGLPVMLAVSSPGESTGLPTLHLSQMRSANGAGSIITNPKAFLEGLKHKVLGYPDFASHPPGPRAAVGAARDSLERNLAYAVSLCKVLECDSLSNGIAIAHERLDAAGYKAQDRVTLMSHQVWEKQLKEQSFYVSPELAPGLRLWGRNLCLRNPYLEVQAVTLHRSAVVGGITPAEPAEGSAASAAVRAEVIQPDGVHVLVWR